MRHGFSNRTYAFDLIEFDGEDLRRRFTRRAFVPVPPSISSA
jgi:hypothetical protein